MKKKICLLSIPDEILCLSPKKTIGSYPSHEKNFKITTESVNRALIKDALIQPPGNGNPLIFFSTEHADDVKVIGLVDEQTNFNNIPLYNLYRELCDISHLCDSLERFDISGLQTTVQLAKFERKKREIACRKRIKNTSSKKLLKHIRHIPESLSPDKVGKESFRLGLSEWRFRSEDGEEKDFYDMFSERKLENVWELLKKESFPHAHELKGEIEKRLEIFS